MNFSTELRDEVRSYSGPPSSPPPPERRTLAQSERSLLAEVDSTADPRPALERLASLYARFHLPAQAVHCLKRLLAMAQDVESQARYHHRMGLLHEEFGDFPEAAAHYRRGLALEPADPGVAYWLNNLLAFCLQASGQFADAEFYARRAMEIGPGRPNAPKNLGLALTGQGRFSEAAEAFIAGLDADPTDSRSYCLLDNLLARHPEMLPEFGDELERCWQAVEAAREVAIRGHR